MEFRVLGPVEVWGARGPLDAGHVKQRSVLAVLLLELGHLVPIELLIDRVWGDSPPASVRNNVYAYVAKLRSVIAEAGDNEVNLARQSGGYLLEADADRVDLHRFRGLAGEAATADDSLAGQLLSEALGLWRGPPLAGLHSPWLSGMREALESQRIGALLDLGDIALRHGEHAELRGKLATEAVAHPVDERLIGQLMLALYRSGRQAEALRWFEQTRCHLAEELGADPGPALAGLHRQILRSDPALAVGELTSDGVAGRQARAIPGLFEVPAPRSAGPSRRRLPGSPAWLRRAIAGGAVAATCSVLVLVGVILGISFASSGNTTAANTTSVTTAPPPPLRIGPACGSVSSVSGEPRLCVSQPHGDLATVFVVRYSGFRPGADVSLTLIYYPPPAPSATRPMTLLRLAVAANGSVRLGTFQLGVYEVVASAPGKRRVSAAFQVLPRIATDGGGGFGPGVVGATGVRSKGVRGVLQLP